MARCDIAIDPSWGHTPRRWQLWGDFPLGSTSIMVRRVGPGIRAGLSGRAACRRGSQTRRGSGELLRGADLAGAVRMPLKDQGHDRSLMLAKSTRCAVHWGEALTSM
jgi:hypothetical protein